MLIIKFICYVGAFFAIYMQFKLMRKILKIIM